MTHPSESAFPVQRQELNGYGSLDVELKRGGRVLGNRVCCSECQEVGPTCQTEDEAIERWNAEVVSNKRAVG